MAEISTNQSSHKKGPHARAKKLSTRIDLTPMVDLGFLLIAFFMITTTLAKAKCIDIKMPYKEPEQTPDTHWKASLSLTLLPVGDHKIYYYNGENYGGPYSYTTFSPQKGIRDIIRAKKASVDSMGRAGLLRPGEQTCVLIKPAPSSTYGDLVSLLDEMLINGIGVYAVVDISPAEQAAISGAN